MKRRGALAGVVLALAIVVAACGGGNSNAAVSIKTLQAAASNTQAAESSRFVVDVTVNGGQADGLTVHADGVMSGDGKTGTIDVGMPMVGDLEERIVDGTIYMNVGSLPFASSKLDGKQWLKVTVDDLKNKLGGDFSALDSVGSGGLQQGLEYLQGLSGDVTKVGEDTVAGRPATHYRASIDYSKLADKLPDGEKLHDSLAKLGTIPADVWIDGNDRVVKMNLTIDGSAFGGGAGAVDLSMEITDFDVPVDVQAPPEDQTVDLLSLNSLAT
jgi:hypothetical protein